MKALVGAFNQEKALVGAFSVIVQPVEEPMDRFTALVTAVHATFLRSSPVLQAVLGRGERPLGLLHGVLQLPDLLLQTGGLLLVVVQLLNVSNVNMLLTTRTREIKETPPAVGRTARPAPASPSPSAGS